MAALQAANLFGVAGKRVLVTGGGSGIGAMMAAGFAANGASVIIASRNAEALAATAAEVKTTTSADIETVVADLGSRAGCEALAAAVAAAPLDVLVNNSGTSWGEPLDRESGRANWGWDKVLDLNVKAPFYLTRALRPALEAAAGAGAPARVVMVGSVAGLTHQPTPTHAYDTSKAALHSLTKKFASDLAPKVTVNAIAPGFVPSRMTKGLEAWGITLDGIAKHVPLGRVGAADLLDVARHEHDGLGLLGQLHGVARGLGVPVGRDAELRVELRVGPGDLHGLAHERAGRRGPPVVVVALRRLLPLLPAVLQGLGLRVVGERRRRLRRRGEVLGLRDLAAVERGLVARLLERRRRRRRDARRCFRCLLRGFVQLHRRREVRAAGRRELLHGGLARGVERRLLLRRREDHDRLRVDGGARRLLGRRELRRGRQSLLRACVEINQ